MVILPGTAALKLLSVREWSGMYAFEQFVAESTARRGVAVVEVKTLDASAGYEPYEATRAFWQSRGFP